MMLVPEEEDSREKVENALVVTQAQERKKEAAEARQREKELQAGAKPNPVDKTEPEDADEELLEEENQADDTVTIGKEWSDDIFLQRREDKKRKPRSQKREKRRQHGLVRAKDKPGDVKKVLDQTLDFGREELSRQQEQDETLAAVRERSQQQSKPGEQGFFRREGIIYRRWIPPQKEKEMGVDQIVLPKICRRSILRIAHTLPTAGHLGQKKTAERILKRFYWPTLYKDVADFCRSCDKCQKSTHRKVPKAPMIPVPAVEEPFARIAMDIVGPLPRSRAGNRYVLVLCDYATRYPEAIALRSIDAENIAEVLIELFARVGIPKEILTDQGTNFTSKLLAELYRLLHVKALRTSPYHPQSDGVVERFNQTLKDMLRKTACEGGKDWDKLLPYVLFAYREVPQESTGFSPFELLYGRDVRGPLDIVKESWEESSGGERDGGVESIISYILLMRERLEKMTALVQTNLANAQAQQKSWYDKKAQERHFKPGDQVLVLLPTSTSKLLAQWQGPFKVLKEVGRVNYLVETQSKRKPQRIYHVNMLKKWHTPTSTSYLALTKDDEEEIPTWCGAGGEKPAIGDISSEKKVELEGLLQEFHTVMQEKPGSTNITSHRIITGDAHPIRLPPYRLPQAYRESVQQEIQEMLAHGVIKPSNSDWAAPLVIVKKKDGSLRMCVDYRRLNSISKVDAYPMPRVDEMLDQLGRAKYISTMDLTKGYWQVPVAEEDQQKTAFATPFGLFEFTRMPFGLQGAPATFQRMMDKLLNGLGAFAKAYMDDLVIFSETWEEHMLHLRTIFRKLKKAGLTAKPQKCQFAMAQCVYLGHVVGRGRVGVEESKVEAVKNFPTPKSKKDVRSFLGLSGYYRKFIS